MPYGTPTTYVQGSTYSLRASHSINDTVPVVITVTLGDSGASEADADAIFQDLVDLFSLDPTFTVVECRKSYPTQCEVTATGTN